MNKSIYKLAIFFIILKETFCYYRIKQYTAGAKTNKYIGNSNSFTQNFTNYDDKEYVGKIKIGPKKKEFTCLWDTGSSWTWVEKVGCDFCSSTTNKYNCSTGNCDTRNTSNHTITYGKGIVEAFPAYDSFDFGGNLSVTN